MCQLDADCDPYGTNRLCVLRNSSQVGTCACNFYFGWTGSDCDELSSRSYVQIGLIVPAVVFSFLAAFISFHTLRTTWKMETRRRNQTRCDKLMSIRMTSISYSMLAAVSCGGWALSQMTAITAVSGPPLVDINAHPEHSTYSRSEFLSLTIFGPAAILFLFLGTTNLVLMWMRLGNSSSRINSKRSELRAFVKIVRVAKIGFTFITVLFVNLESWVVGMPYVHGYFVGIVSFLLCVVFIKGSREVKMLIEDAKPPARRMSVEQTRNTYQRIINNVTKTTYPMVFGLVVLGVSSFMTSLMDSINSNGWRVYMTQEDFSFFVPVFTAYLRLYSVVFVTWTAVMYLYHNALNRLRYQANNGPLVSVGWIQNLRHSIRTALSPLSIRKDYGRHNSQTSAQSLGRPTTIVIHDI